MLILVSGATKTLRGLLGKVENLGHLVTPGNGNSMASIMATGLPWAADNGAYSGFDPVAFRKFLKKIAGHPGCIFIACPDVVSNAKRTVEMFDCWRDELSKIGPLAFVLQDGQEDLDLPIAHAYFIGGSNDFKESLAAMDLVAEGQRRGAWIHMGRVNSKRRMKIAREMRCDSIDGTKMSKFSDSCLRQFCAWGKELKEQQLLDFQKD